MNAIQNLRMTSEIAHQNIHGTTMPFKFSYNQPPLPFQSIDRLQMNADLECMKAWNEGSSAVLKLKATAGEIN